MQEKLYPIAEIFIAPQGEGRWVGHLMTFIRLAGCTVGKPFTSDEDRRKMTNFDSMNGLKIYQEKCTLWDGRSFVCDTNFKMSKKMTVSELVTECSKDLSPYTICITGGEPLMHDIYPLVCALKERTFAVHVETSGTIPIDLNQPIWHRLDWVTVSPKKGFLDSYAELNVANEFKILVDKNFNWNKVPDSIKAHMKKIYLQPVNFEHDINMDNVELCKKLQLFHPLLKISMQGHKVWNSR